VLYVPDHAAPFLDVARVRAALAGTRLADVRYVAETASTNADAAGLLGDPAAAGATLVAEFQHAGRGRKPGRAWLAPTGSALLFTTILPDAIPADSLCSIPFWAALSFSDGVEAGVYRGETETRRLWGTFFEVFDRVVVEPLEFIEQGDHVVVPHHLRAWGRDGLAVDAHAVVVFTLREGRIVELRPVIGGG